MDKNFKKGTLVRLCSTERFPLGGWLHRQLALIEEARDPHQIKVKLCNETLAKVLIRGADQNRTLEPGFFVDLENLDSSTSAPNSIADRFKAGASVAAIATRFNMSILEVEDAIRVGLKKKTF